MFVYFVDIKPEILISFFHGTAGILFGKLIIVVENCARIRITTLLISDRSHMLVIITTLHTSLGCNHCVNTMSGHQYTKPDQAMLLLDKNSQASVMLLLSSIVCRYSNAPYS